MADAKIGKAVLELTIDDTQYKFALGEIEKGAKDAQAHLKGISEAVDFEVFKQLGEYAFEAFKKIGEGIIQLGEHGSDVADVANGFDLLSQKVGATGDEMLGKLRAGTVGTISDFDLMKLANSALGNGLVKSAGDMGTLAEGARLLAKRTGGDTKEAFDVLTSAMATGRTATLKHLGVFVDAKVATDNFAASIGKDASELTQHEKATALSQATLVKLKQALAEAGPEALDFKEVLEQGKTALANMYDQVARGVAQSPVMMAGLNAIGKELKAAFGGEQTNLVHFLVSAVEQFSIMVARAGSVVVTIAQGMSRAWEVLVIGINEVGVIVSSVSAVIIGAFARIAEGVNKLSGGKLLAGVSESMKEAAKDAEAMAKGFEKNVAAEMKGADERSAALEKVKQAAVRVADAMLGAQGKVIEGHEKVNTAIKKTGEEEAHVSQKMKDEARKIADTMANLQAEITMGQKIGLDKRLAEIEAAKTKELQTVTELKGATLAQKEEMVRLVNQKYQQMADAARLGNDKIKDSTQKLQNWLVQSTMTNKQKELAQIEVERAAELRGLEELKEHYGKDYDALTKMVQQKYNVMAAAAKGEGLTVQQAAERMGFKSREELNHTAQVALETYNRMKQSHEFTAHQMEEAWKKYEKAKQEATGKGAAYQKVTFDQIASWASSMLTSIFGKSKAAAIAGATIDLAAALVKTMRSTPWPANIPFLAMEAAAGIAQIAKIKSSSFARGTAALDFQAFGPLTEADLHGNEAVIPQGSGHRLASEIGASMQHQEGMGWKDVVSRLDKLNSSMEKLPQTLKRAYRDGALMAT